MCFDFKLKCIKLLFYNKPDPVLNYICGKKKFRKQNFVRTTLVLVVINFTVRLRHVPPFYFPFLKCRDYCDVEKKKNWIRPVWSCCQAKGRLIDSKISLCRLFSRKMCHILVRISVHKCRETSGNRRTFSRPSFVFLNRHPLDRPL